MCKIGGYKCGILKMAFVAKRKSAYQSGKTQSPLAGFYKAGPASLDGNACPGEGCLKGLTL